MGYKVVRTVREWVRKFVPIAVHDKVLFAFGRGVPLFTDVKARKEAIRIPVQKDVELDVFWKELPEGPSPALSLFIDEMETIRLDCFGKGIGHMHFAGYCPHTSSEDRIFFREDSREEQVERSIFELQRNLMFYLERSPKRRIRELKIDPEKLGAACEKARELMLEIIAPPTPGREKVYNPLDE